jgi:competence protein ComEA
VPTELDPAADPDAPSKAAEVLDRLARERPTGALRRRSWRLRQVGPGQRSEDGADPPFEGRGDGAGGTTFGWAHSAAVRRNLTIVVVVLVALGVTMAVLLAGRPPPIEDRLPLATSTDMVAPSSGVPHGADGSSADSSGADADAAGADGPGGGGSGNPTEASPGSTQVVVHVAGAVTSPGVVRLSAGSRVVDAVTAAGGLRADADPDRVNLAAPLTDGQRVVVPVLGQPAPAEVGGAGVGSAGSGAADGGAVTGPVDLNTATAEQLDTLPGVGPSTAAAIIEHRESSGPFRSVDALLDVRGIGEAKLDALRDLVTVGAA